jgi:hypothetical protein
LPGLTDSYQHRVVVDLRLEVSVVVRLVAILLAVVGSIASADLVHLIVKVFLLLLLDEVGRELNLDFLVLRSEDVQLGGILLILGRKRLNRLVLLEHDLGDKPVALGVCFDLA